jgi:hypothetical protein
MVNGDVGSLHRGVQVTSSRERKPRVFRAFYSALAVSYTRIPVARDRRWIDDAIGPSSSCTGLARSDRTRHCVEPFSAPRIRALTAGSSSARQTKNVRGSACMCVSLARG